jgi:hypothetical protein
MSRTRARIVGAITAAAIAGVSAASCVPNDGSLVVIGLLSPPATSSSGSTCGYTANLIGPFMSYGTMDIAFTQQYSPVLLLGNQMVPQSNPKQSKVETDDVIVQGAIVRVTDVTGATLDNYTVPGDAFVPAASGGVPGLAAFGTTLVSSNAVAAFGGTGALGYGVTKRLISYVTVFGTTTGGSHIESGEVGIPVNACNGCLVSFPAEADDPALLKQPNCLATGQTGSSVSSPCVAGQDQPIDCRLCQGYAACDPSLR